MLIPTNRWLIYASLMLTPAQALSGIASNCPSNIGFLAYNWWQQYTWFTAVKKRDLHALSLLPIYFNMLYTVTYLGDIFAGNVAMGVVLGLGTAGLIIMNTITAWISWKTNLPEGVGLYQFYFFGWRVLSEKWRKLFLVWEIFDTMVVANAVVASVCLGIRIPGQFKVAEREKRLFRWARGTAMFWGSALMLLATWPLILWMELIVKKNNIVSETDMIAVWLFIAQVATMVIPSVTSLVAACWRWLRGAAGQDVVLPMTALSHDDDTTNAKPSQ